MTVHLTTTTALARRLRLDDSLGRVSAGEEVWEVAEIHSLREWIRKSWAASWPDEQLLHPVQELAAYMAVIDEVGEAEEVLSKTVLGRQARQAGALVESYRMSTENAVAHSPDQVSFLRWHAQVEDVCRRRGWLTNPMLERAVAAKIRSGVIPVPAAVEVHGVMGDLTPAERDVLSAMREMGCEVSHAAGSQGAEGKVSFYEFPTGEAQYRDVAVQIRDILLPFDGDKEAPPDILVLTDDFEAQRDKIEAAFIPVLAPWVRFATEEYRPVPWRFQLGRMVSEYPLVALALDLFGLKAVNDRYDGISRMLLSPVLWAGDAAAQAAALDLQLRELGGNRFSLAWVAAQAESRGLDAVSAQLSALARVVEGAPDEALMSTWAEHLGARLEALGWPGDVDESSVDYQTLTHWQESIATYAALDAQLAGASHERAWHWLREIVATRRFSPRTLHLQPIQIMNYEQAAGLSADHVFVLNMHEGSLPRPVNRVPLLAMEMLTSNPDGHVPYSTPQDCLKRGHQAAMAMLRMAPDVRVCFSKADDRGVAVNASPLFAVAAAGADPIAPEPRPVSVVEELIAKPTELARLADVVPAVTERELPVLRGVSTIFKDYVEAPFIALVKARLGVREFPEAVGLSARVQGNVIHDALAAFWRETRTSEALRALSEEEQRERVRKAVEESAREHMPDDRFGAVFAAVERRRVEALIDEWLDHERRRVDPFEVVHIEVSSEAEVAGLRARVRMDRVDRVRVGDEDRYLMIDYKAGSRVSTSGWDAETLKEPQLPLYASSAALEDLGIPHVDGICFAHLKDGHPAFVAATNWRQYLIRDDVGKPVDNWDEQLAAWKTRLLEIAENFISGDAGLEAGFKKKNSFNSFVLGLTRFDDRIDVQEVCE